MAGVERTVEGPIEIDTTVPDSALTREQIIARNLKVVEAHFHNETPEHVEKAIALYGDTISWEAPTRGVVMNNKAEILEALPKLNAEERREIRAKLNELDRETWFDSGHLSGPALVRR